MTDTTDDATALVLRLLRGVIVVVVIFLAGFLWLHASVTDGWKEDLIDLAPVMLPLIVGWVLLTRALRRRQKHGLSKA